MHKLIKLSNTHYIVVSKDKSTGIHNIIASTEQLEDTSRGVKTIPLAEVQELLGIPTRNKIWSRAMETYFPDYDSHRDIMDRKDQKIIDAFANGYWAALADNKDKKFTFEDMEKAFKEGVVYGCDPDASLKDAEEFDKVINSLSKTEWEVEYDSNGKLKLI